MKLNITNPEMLVVGNVVNSSIITEVIDNKLIFNDGRSAHLHGNTLFIPRVAETPTAAISLCEADAVHYYHELMDTNGYCETCSGSAYFNRHTLVCRLWSTTKGGYRKEWFLDGRKVKLDAVRHLMQVR
jgi:hypothetical protein